MSFFIKSKVKKVLKSNNYLNDSAQFLLDFYVHVKREKFTGTKKWFANALRFYKANTIKGQEDGILLTQMVKDYEYTIKLAAASKVLAEQKNLIVSLYDTNVFLKKNADKINWLYKTLFFKDNNKKLHLSFADSLSFYNSDKYYDQNFIKQELNKILLEIDKHGPEYVLSLKFEDVLVGDLIYDTYLRFFYRPTIENIDYEVIVIIDAALNIFYNFKLYLKSNQVKLLLNIYSCYIHHGISVRICLHNNIEVYTLGSNTYFLQKLTNDFPYHQINHTLFDPEKLIPSSQIELAKKRFSSRFVGKIDSATSYMRQSAYSDAQLNPQLKELFEKNPRNIVLFVHDFYDSPHINRMLQFPDLYQYLKQTLTELKDVINTSVFIKIHPNGMSESKEKTIELVNSLNSKNLHILDESTSNLTIVKLKPTLIATARGTIGIEMAYFEIPTVALYDNLYVNFNFVHSANTKEEYFSILKDESQVNIDFDKEKIYSFYYQAYLEKVPLEEDNIFNILTTFTYKYDAYSDQYLEKIKELKDIIFSQKFSKYYQDSI